MFFFVKPRNPRTVNYFYYYSSSLVITLDQFISSFLLGGRFKQTGGNPSGIEPPSFINGLYKISSRVSLSAGFGTNNFFISYTASGGTSLYFGI